MTHERKSQICKECKDILSFPYYEQVADKLYIKCSKCGYKFEAKRKVDRKTWVEYRDEFR